MSLLELQGLTIESEAGHRPPGSRASKYCGGGGSRLSLLLC
ncbi:SapB/AmfS family lanthipeptide [Streptomyces sp. DT2A-34]|nr:SapB/AmfS family lanthipeptide [Streptomyces sp. DT2A-34]MDO0910292.1 SapB/AmfS family lanthipeptide [Streptomyces sp. DT2A-34]